MDTMRDIVTYQTGDMVLRAVRRLRHGGSVSDIREEIARVENETASWNTVQSHLNCLIRWRLVEINNGWYTARILK